MPDTETIQAQVGVFYDNTEKNNGKSSYAITIDNYQQTGQPKNLYFNKLDPRLMEKLVKGTYISAKILKKQLDKEPTFCVVEDVQISNTPPELPKPDLTKTVTEVDMGKPVNMAIVQNRNMFVTGIVGRWGQSGQFKITDLPTLTKTARDCYNEHLAIDFEEQK